MKKFASATLTVRRFLILRPTRIEAWSSQRTWLVRVRFLIALCTAVVLRGDTGSGQIPLKTPDGFAVPQPGIVFDFPRDHGSHPQFKIEWWYVTGHLKEKGGDRRFGFQATFFQHGGFKPPGSGADGLSDERGAVGASAFGHAPVFLAHMAVLDVKSGEFIHQERLNRSGWDASSSTNTLDVRNGNWSLRMAESAETSETRQSAKDDRIRMVLQGTVRGEAAFDLTLVSTKPLVAFGDEGVSRKAADPTAASHYLTFTRLKADGTLSWGGSSLEVEGLAWMDHEFSSSQLTGDQAGWDWASIHLDDGRDLMVYRMRLLDGSTDTHSRIAWVDKQGGLVQAGPAAFDWVAMDHWISPKTGGRYPVRSRLHATHPLTGLLEVFEFEPLAVHQEMVGTLGGVSYWEGACRVLDGSGREVGRAYVELAGYVGRLADRFK